MEQLNIDKLVGNGWKYVSSIISIENEKLLWILGKSTSYMRILYDPSRDSIESEYVKSFKPNKRLFLSTPIITGINCN